MANGLLGVAIFEEPRRRPPENARLLLCSMPRLLTTKRIANQRVVLEPDAVGSETGQERVRLVELIENFCRIVDAESGIAERCGESIEHRRAQDEFSLVLGQRHHHFGQDVVVEMKPVSTHRLELADRVIRLA